ncbi:hypothetical protein V5799_014891, partial [Amblyomma americanum]
AQKVYRRRWSDLRWRSLSRRPACSRLNCNALKARLEVRVLFAQLPGAPAEER